MSYINPETATRILQATYLQVRPICPDCGHQFGEASRQEIEDHIRAAHVEATCWYCQQPLAAGETSCRPCREREQLTAADWRQP